MPMLTVYVDDRTLALLEKIAADLARSVTDLAEAAVSEAAIQYFRPTQTKDS